MRAIVLTLVLVAALASGLSSSGKVKTVRLNRDTKLSPPRSHWLSKYGNGTNIPVGGSVWPTSIYWTEVQVGTPAKTYAVAIDSGSNALFLSGEDCDGCVTTKPNIPYVPSESNTSFKTGHHFSYSYQTCDPTDPLLPCSISGPYYTDVVSLAGYGPKPIKLGAITKQSKWFYQFHTIDGIMGMVGGPVDQNVFLTLCVEGSVCEPIWAICMHEGKHSNGTMTVGGVDERLADGLIQYVPRPANLTGIDLPYILDVFNITFGSHWSKTTTVQTNSSTTYAVLDTGTNNVLLPTPLLRAAQTAFCSNTSAAHCNDFFAGKCFNLTDAEVAAYPDITLQLDKGVQLHMTPRDYLLLNSPAGTPGEYCFGLGDGGNYFIIGDTLMRNYYLVFTPNHVGWGKVNTATCGSL